MEGAGLITGLLHSGEMPTAPTTTSSSFLLYNPGTQPCNTLLQIGGSGTDITLANATNETFCKLYSLPDTGYLEIDSKYGKVTWVHGSNRDTFFEFHNEGYLTLDPYLPREFGVDASYTSGSNVISCSAFFPTEDLIGKYIRLRNAWRKITNVSEENATIEISGTMTASGSELTKIVTMNEITITGTLLTLNKLSIDYYPIIV